MVTEDGKSLKRGDRSTGFDYFHLLNMWDENLPLLNMWHENLPMFLHLCLCY